MPVNATIRLDSGFFFDPLQLPIGYDYWDVGYFQCDQNCPDIRVYVDGVETKPPTDIKLGKGTNIEIIHLDANGNMKTGVDNSGLANDQKLHRTDLYGVTYPENRSAFDSVLRFHSGKFRGSMIKKRYFKPYLPAPAPPPSTPPPMELGPIAHDVLVQYTLQNGEILKITSAGIDIWRSDQSSATFSVDLELLGDNTTATKFYCDALPTGLSCYWVPNQGDPPPTWQP